MSYKEKVENVSIGDFFLERIFADMSEWCIASSDTNLSTIEMVKAAVSHREKTNECTVIKFSFPLDEEVFEPELVIMIHLLSDEIFAGYSIIYNEVDSSDSTFSIEDIEKVEYDGFTFYNIDKCIERGIEYIKKNIDYSRLDE